MRFSYSSWTTFVERHHRAMVLGSALLSIACAVSLTRLRPDIDVLSMLPRGTPAFDEFRTFVGDFGELNQLVVLVEGPDRAQLQSFADDLAPRLAALDTVARVQARVDVDHLLSGLLGRHLYRYIPEEAYPEVARRLTAEAIEKQVEIDRAILSAPFDLSATQAVVQDPLGLRRWAAAALSESAGTAPMSLDSGYFASADGSALIVLVRPKASAFDIAFSERLMGQVREAVRAARQAVGAGAAAIRVAYTGSYAYALEDQATLKWDIGRYTLLSLLGVLAVFYLGYRNLRILPFILYPLLVTTLVTFALSLLFYRQLNALSYCFAAILYGLSIDSAIHYYTRLLQERDRAATLADAVRATLAALGRANIAASATTAAAFLVIGSSVLGAVSQIGVLTAVGMAISTLLFFTLYPALTFLMTRSFALSPTPPETPRLEAVGRFSTTHARAVAAAAGVLALALLLPALDVHLDVALTHLRPADSEAVRVQEEIEARFGASQTSGAVVVRRGDLEQALADAEVVARRLRSYREDGAVALVQSVDGVLPSAKAQRARLRLFEELPRREAAAELRQALARQHFAPEKFAAFVEAFVAAPDETTILRPGHPDLAPLAALIDHYVQPHDGGSIVAVYVEPAPGVRVAEIERRLRRDLPDLPFGVASRALLEEELAAVLRRELTWFCVFGVAGNFLLLLLMFRRFGAAAAVLAPVILVAVALFAGMAVSGVALDPVNLIVTPLLFGIGVDYGVYVVARTRECNSASRALRLCGRALTETALTTVAGFGFLAFSRYPFLAHMGLLAGIGLLLCLLLALVVLPALLVVCGEQSASPGEA